MNKVTKEQAQSEVEAWLDYKKIGSKKRESQEAQIETLVDAVAEGDLVLNEDKSFTQKLKFEVGEEIKILELKYRPRLDMSTIHSKLDGVKSSDGDGRVLAYVAALTGQVKSVIKKLDSEDYSVAQSIAIFFL